MFTGIVETTGTVLECQRGKKSDRLRIDARWLSDDLKIGSSVAVNGACLTVVAKKAGAVSFDMIGETRKRTTLCLLKAGQPVNLERALKKNGRIEGHIVQGHIDGMGRIIEVRKSNKQISFLVRYPEPLKRYIVEKGSISVDGVSLTIGKVTDKGFWVHCIPHTFNKTIFRFYKTGTRVNLESDIIARLILR